MTTTPMMFPELRAAYGYGWITMIVDPQSWTFHVYVGDMHGHRCRIAEAFKEHLRCADKLLAKATYDRVGYNEEDLNRAERLVDRKLDCDFATSMINSHNGLVGMTAESKSGPIFVFVPGFSMTPRSIAVLAHELTHAARIFTADKLRADPEDDEFFCNMQTTLLERVLWIYTHVPCDACAVGIKPIKKKGKH